MKTVSLMALLTGTALIATPVVAEPLDIASVETAVTLEDVDSNALDFWPEIAEDMTTLVSAGLIDQITESGDYKVKVDVQEMSLGGATVLGPDGAFNQLNGWVYLFGPESDVQTIEKFQIEMSAEQGAIATPENMIVAVPQRSELQRFGHVICRQGCRRGRQATDRMVR